MNPVQEQALAQLNANRTSFVEKYPNQWIAVNAYGEARAAPRFDILIGASDIDAERLVFAFVAVGAWA